MFERLTHLKLIIKLLQDTDRKKVQHDLKSHCDPGVFFMDMWAKVRFFLGYSYLHDV